MEAFMYRHNPQTAKLVELVRGGAIGELRLVRAVFSYSLYDPGNIRLQPEVEGGALMDVGCYCVSGSRLLAGEPESALGQARIGETGTDWVFTGLMRFPGDVLAQFDCGTALPERDELEAIGSEGSLFLDDPWHCRKPGIELRTADGVERIETETTDSYRLELENLSDAIRGEGTPLLGRDDAVQQARVIEALFRSADSGRFEMPAG
jgi:predicted dehydrogenase